MIRGSGVIKLPTPKKNTFKGKTHQNSKYHRFASTLISQIIYVVICVYCIFDIFHFSTHPRLQKTPHAELHNLHDLSHPTCNTWSMGVPTNSMPGTQSMRVEAKTLGIHPVSTPPPPVLPVSNEDLFIGIPY